ncbi:hypothetical protein E5347_09015 [Clostridium sartagoforme]|uniref:Glycosyltransferase n=1 Tax=Clostridium sartagoforme TaxID=84031 RepID=A0A4V3RL50_9CLOT|nr:glycosyltransferase family 4 protein [Clostridium sartagoforme]TGY42350.1 hypothetical protein E5347_09015 [Clostridium sartagoforme]
MHRRKTFLFIRKSMGIGGIETYIFRTVKKLRKDGNRIIWVFPDGGYIDDGFRSEFFNNDVEIIRVNLDKINWIDNLNINFEEFEEVIALAFNIYDFAFLEMIKSKYKNTDIDSFFWVPHFEGKSIFIEEFAPKIVRPILNKYIRKIIISMEDNNNIIYVNQSHLDAFKNKYKYNIINENSKLLLTSNREVPEYDADLINRRSERNKFNIITISRFSFPHKAYILGLIRSYGVLKKSYNQLKLTIIGYGEHENILKNEISKLSEEAKQDLHLVGKVHYTDLNKYFKDANLNIGVGSTIIDGALTGLISIPVRHYTEECEGYGYLPLNKKYLTSIEKGEPIEKYIEEVINMDKSEYQYLSLKSYETYSKQEDSTNVLMSMKNVDNKRCLNKKYIRTLIVAYKLAKYVRGIKLNK